MRKYLDEKMIKWHCSKAHFLWVKSHISCSLLVKITFSQGFHGIKPNTENYILLSFKIEFITCVT